jgi:hypothetical protein
MNPAVEQWLATISAQMALQIDLLGRQQQQQQQSARREDSYIEKLGKRIEQSVSNQLAARLGQAQSLANRGFSGTVEQARMDYAMEQLGRQFASVMKPVMDALTYGAAQIELRMRMMGRGNQDALLGIGVGAVAGRTIGGLFGYGGLGMLAGGALGHLVGGSGWGDNAGGFGALAGAGIGARFGGLTGAAVGGTVGLATAPVTSGDYGRLRKEGNSRLASAFGSVVASIYDLGYGIFGGDAKDSETNKARAEHAAKFASAAERKRKVTPFQSDMMEAGGAYFAMQKGVIRATTGADFEENNILKPIIDAIGDVVDAILGLPGKEKLGAKSATDAATPATS